MLQRIREGEEEREEENADTRRGANTKKLKSTNDRKEYYVLTELMGMGMVWSYMRDYPHGYLIGVVFHLWKRWINWKSSIRIMKQQQHEINEHLMQMIPPHEIHRLVRPSTTEKCKCKALEWRNWLQFYDIPCLTRILHDYALQHFALIVKSIFTLLRTNITEEKLRKTKHDLLLFVYTYEILYGERFVTFNVHIVKYLVKCVK